MSINERLLMRELTIVRFQLIDPHHIGAIRHTTIPISIQNHHTVTELEELFILVQKEEAIILIAKAISHISGKNSDKRK